MITQTALSDKSAIVNIDGLSGTGSETVTLATQLIVDGMQARQLWRRGNIAIYERGSGLELIFITRDGATTLPNGDRLPPRERYPRPAQWGKQGWSFDSWRLSYLVAFAEKLANMRKNPGELVGKCMRDTRLWLQHLGPLRRPTGMRTRVAVSTDSSVFPKWVDSLHVPAAGFAPGRYTTWAGYESELALEGAAL
jgi:hypothetical protein